MRDINGNGDVKCFTSDVIIDLDINAISVKAIFQNNRIKTHKLKNRLMVQLPLKRLPDSSVSSLIPAGLCRRASHPQKLAPTFPGIDSCLMAMDAW